MDMKNEIIVVKQLPVIEEHLKQISEEIEVKINSALSLECNDENVKEVKTIRADLKKVFTDLESKRKAVKNKILEPYNNFEEIYKKYISDKFKNADADLKNKIDDVENQLKNKKNEEVKAYFNELLEKYNIGFVRYEQVNINVTLTASMKSLKEKVEEFVEKINDDLKLIETQQYKDEILVEYMKTLNVSKAITDVSDRHFILEQVKNDREIEKEKAVEEEKAVKKVEKVIAPIEEEKIFCVSFKVFGTKEQLIDLKKFLNDGGYKYE